MIFCPRCGAILVPKKDGKRMSCACGYSSKQKQNVIIEEKVQLAGDEAETRFFECVKCKNRWRSYN